MITTSSVEAGTSIPARSSQVVEIPRQSSFHIKIGTYPATIRSVNVKYRQSVSESVPFARLMFAVDVPNANVDYLAKIDFKLDFKEDTDLWNVVCRLLGRKQLLAANGKFDLHSLVGIRCDIVVDHVYVDPDTYDFPLVVITDIQPEGSLIKPVGKKEN